MRSVPRQVSLSRRSRTLYRATGTRTAGGEGLAWASVRECHPSGVPALRSADAQAWQTPRLSSGRIGYQSLTASSSQAPNLAGRKFSQSTCASRPRRPQAAHGARYRDSRGTSPLMAGGRSFREARIERTGPLGQCPGMSLERYGRAGEPGAGAEHLSSRLKLMTPDGYRERL